MWPSSALKIEKIVQILSLFFKIILQKNLIYLTKMTNGYISYAIKKLDFPNFFYFVADAANVLRYFDLLWIGPDLQKQKLSEFQHSALV